MPSVVVLAHIFCLNAKKVKIPTKLDANAADAVIGLNENDQESEVDVDLTDDQ